MRTLSALFLAALLFAGCGGAKQNYPGEASAGDLQRTPSGLAYLDIVTGAGDSPEEGAPVTVHYTGYLMDGKKFDSSVDRKEPFTFVAGVGQVIKGWDEGVMGMKVGGKRKLIIPSQLAYGDRGVPGLIPSGADLVFDIELLRVGAQQGTPQP